MFQRCTTDAYACFVCAPFFLFEETAHNLTPWPQEKAEQQQQDVKSIRFLSSKGAPNHSSCSASDLCWKKGIMLQMFMVSFCTLWRERNDVKRGVSARAECNAGNESFRWFMFHFLVCHLGGKKDRILLCAIWISIYHHHHPFAVVEDPPLGLFFLLTVMGSFN